MASMATKTPYTPDDLLGLPDAVNWELVDGQLVERTMAGLSSYVGGTLVTRLRNHCDSNNLGWVFRADAGYQCFPDSPNKVRTPDVSFICRERLADGPPERDFVRIAPDLAVEVLSPNEFAYEVEVKIQEYLDAGVEMVWEVIPETRSVMVHRSDGTSTRLRQDDELTGEAVLPGFHVKVSELFLPLPQNTSD